MTRFRFAPLTLQYLPVELLCNIFGYLDMRDLLTCSQLSKSLQEVISNSSRLQYIIELGRRRMVSVLPPSASPSYATRLKLLRDREQAWRHLDWKSRRTLNLPPTGSVYEFIGGFYGNGREEEDSRKTASISFLELPSMGSIGDLPPELAMWTHSMQDLTIIDFTMDPSQDLLVLVAFAPPESKYIYELHLRSLRTNTRHSKAPIPVLPCLRKSTANTSSSMEVAGAVRVQVAGSLVALLVKEVFDTPGAHLEIWNWDNNAQYSCSMTQEIEIDDFTFLSQDSFLLVRNTGKFEVYTFTTPARCNTTPLLRATYHFPALSDGYMYWYVSMSSNPAPGYVPKFSTADESSPNYPRGKQIYYPRPDDRIHAVCLYIFKTSGEENHLVHCFVFFINLQTLLNPPSEWLSSPHTTRSTKFATSSPNGGSDSAYLTSALVSPTTPPSSSVPIHTSLNSNDSSPISHMTHTVSTVNPASLTSPYPLFPTFDSYTLHQPPSNPAHNTLPSTTQSPTLPTPAPPFPINGVRRPGQARDSLTSLTYVDVPWEVWGPQSTRWFEECLSTDWQHAIYGLRTVETVLMKKKMRKKRKRPTVLSTNGSDSLSSSSSLASNEPSCPTVANSPASASELPNTSSSTVVNSPASASEPPSTPSEVASSPPSGESSSSSDEDKDGPHVARRFLRLRDFNPYSFKICVPPASENAQGKGKHKAQWHTPRLITGPSTTPVKGVFTHDIVSSLPYTEVVSTDSFEVTDVMMDDCRLLLLKRGVNGKLERVDVLMM